jgi:hypothetical protein
MALISLLLSSALVAFVSGQYTGYGCDHYSLLPTDECIGFGTYDYYYSCNGSETMMFETYSSGDCGTTDGMPSLSVTLDLTSSVYSGLAECGSGSSCAYFATSCSDTWYLTTLVDVCMASTSTSTMFSCSDSSLTTTAYTGATDCSGSSSSSTVDYSSNSLYSDCTFMCTGTGSSDANGKFVGFSMFVLAGAALYSLF